jgi:ribose transport system ATP-binding protein
MSKSFGATRALSSVSLEISAGEVHALVGQNGSGKSTLIKLLAGFHEPENGSVVAVEGTPVPLGHPAASREAGFRFVHQDLALVNDLSVVENLGLGRGFSTGFGGRIRWRQERREATSMMRELGFELDVRRPVGELAQAERTGVAIARALWDWQADAKVLVLDEPTAALPSAEVEVLFAAIRRVAERGLGVLYVSHRLDEIFAIADRVTVLRDGRKVGTFGTEKMAEGRLVSLMIGEAVLRSDAPARPRGGSPVLEAFGLSGKQVRGVDFNAYAGEVLGFVGLTGSGREEILELIFGARRRGGVVRVLGSDVPIGDPRASVARGIALVPADRHRQGVVLEMSVKENSTLTGLKPFRTRLGAIRRRLELAEVRTWLARLDVRPPDPAKTLFHLSGGNQQKVVLGKWLRLGPRVLLLDEPTQGIDIGAKALIHGLIRQAADEGAAVVVATSDDEEICDVCDVVYVLLDGQLVAERRRSELLVDELGLLKLGGSPQADVQAVGRPAG